MVTFRSGSDWKPIEGTEDYYSRDLIHAAGHFIGVGDQIITSQDGLQWTERMALPEGQEPLTQVVYGNGRLVAISLDSIWSSGSIHFLSLTKKGDTVNLTLFGARNSTYRIDYRDTLNSDAPWHPLTTTMLEEESQTWIDNDVAGQSIRLYRAELISE